MSKKNYRTTRNRQLAYWQGPSVKQTLRAFPNSGVKSDKESTVRKLDMIMEVFPDTQIWKDILERVKSKKLLSNKQMDALNRTYFKVKYGEYRKYEKKKGPVIWTVSF